MFLVYLVVKAVLGTIGCGATIYLPISGLTNNIERIDSIIKLCGEIGELERIKDFYKYHLIEYIGQSYDCLQFRFAYKYIGLENFEIQEDIEHRKAETL